MTTEAMIKLSDAVVKAMGGLEKATAEMTFFYQEFTSESEKLADAVKAAAKTINREIPKLQDELIKLSEDVIQEVKKIADDLDAGLEDLSGALEDTGNFWVDTQRRLADEWAKGIAANAEAIADGSANAWEGAVTTWQLWQIVEEGLTSYGDTLRELGYDVDNGVQAFLKSLTRIRDAVTDPLKPTGTSETITIPGDPNAAILAKLLDDLPKTREGFNELIGGLKLTDEASLKLYAGLMELLPQFDLLYDGVEAFTDWLLGVDEVGQATRELTAVFKDWGMGLPTNREALQKLYTSGKLTTEQMAILGAYVTELGLVFGNLEDEVGDLTNKLSGLEAAYSVLEKSVSAQKDAINATYEARIDALNAERSAVEAATSAQREAIQTAMDMRLESLDKEREAAQESASAISSALSSIQSAISSLRGQLPSDEITQARANSQLAAWANSRTLPTDETLLERVLQGATNINAEDYGSEAAYRLAQAGTLSNLSVLEEVGLKSASTAEKTLAAIDAQTEQVRASGQAQLDALEARSKAQLDAIQKQIDAAAAWRDAELARLDKLLADAQKQMEIQQGTYVETKNLTVAIKEFNAALKAVDPKSTPIVLGTLNIDLNKGMTALDTRLAAQTAVLIADTAQRAQQSAQQNAELLAIRTEIVALRKDMAVSSSTGLVALRSVDDRLKRWDDEGLPETRDDDTNILVLRAG
jgi:hypothetical protein